MMLHASTKPVLIVCTFHNSPAGARGVQQLGLPLVPAAGGRGQAIREARTESDSWA